MLNLLVDVVANFGVSSLFSNIGTGLITKSDSKILNKVAIGLGTFIVGSMVEEAAADHIKRKLGLLKEEVVENTDEKEDEEDGREVSE